MTTLPPICRALAMGLNEEFEKMKTPQEAAREYAETLWNRESTLEWDVSRDACKSRSERDFLAGEEFGYRRGIIESFQWLPISEGNPEKYDFVIMKDEREPIHTKGYFVVSGERAKNWGFPYIKSGYTHWRPIERVKNKKMRPKKYFIRMTRMFLAGKKFGYRRGFADAWRWIPVSEQLPEEGRKVLVKEESISPNTDETAKTNIKGYELAVWNGCEWQLEYIDKPTHWRLIEPVKK